MINFCESIPRAWLCEDRLQSVMQMARKEVQREIEGKKYANVKVFETKVCCKRGAVLLKGLSLSVGQISPLLKPKQWSSHRWKSSGRGWKLVRWSKKWRREIEARGKKRSCGPEVGGGHGLEWEMYKGRLRRREKERQILNWNTRGRGKRLCWVETAHEWLLSWQRPFQDAR